MPSRAEIDFIRKAMVRQHPNAVSLQDISKQMAS